MTIRALPSPVISEADLLSRLLEWADAWGWLTNHQRPALTSKGWRTATQGNLVGWPDVIAVRGTRLVVAELKSDKGRTTPEQKRWLAAFRLVPGAEVFEWRPADWPEIVATLKPEVAA